MPITPVMLQAEILPAIMCHRPEKVLVVIPHIAASEPVSEAGDLFGAVVQLAARLCAKAAPRSILVASSVRDLAAGNRFTFGPVRTLRLKGFDEPTRACTCLWEPGPPASDGPTETA